MDKVYAEAFKDKIILVTGGTGSIGSEIVKKVLTFPVKQVRVFSRDEFKQFQLEKELKDVPKDKISFFIGDIRDRERVFLAMEGVDIVFNAAAMKHVHLCEYNPFEAIKTNVMGTQNLVDAARANDIQKFVHISTDKAAMPVSVMGATKLLAEKIAVSGMQYRGSRNTLFCAVRFGNVLGSRGSVVPLFCEQIKNGGPVTLTDKNMTRFMMEIPRAVELVLSAACYMKGSELYILKMPVMKIEDVAKAMIEILAPKFGRKASDIKIDVKGKREGEKIYELLMTDEEAENVYENDLMLCLTKKPVEGFKPSGLKHYRSDEVKLMSYEEVFDYMKDYLSKSKIDV